MRSYGVTRRGRSYSVFASREKLFLPTIKDFQRTLASVAHLHTTRNGIHFPPYYLELEQQCISVSS